MRTSFRVLTIASGKASVVVAFASAIRVGLANIAASVSQLSSFGTFLNQNQPIASDFVSRLSKAYNFFPFGIRIISLKPYQLFCHLSGSLV
jgi:hypothetical protein